MTEPNETQSFTDEEWASADKDLAGLIDADRGTEEFDGYVAAINHRQATLAQVRKAKRLTQQQLAAALDVSQAQVSRIEATDINVMLITLANLSIVFVRLRAHATGPKPFHSKSVRGSRCPFPHHTGFGSQR